MRNEFEIRKTLASKCLGILRAMPEESRRLAPSFLYHNDLKCGCFLGSLWQDGPVPQATTVTDIFNTIIEPWFPDSWEYTKAKLFLYFLMKENDDFEGTPEDRWTHMTKILESWM